jgi:hypothetical protein
MESVLYRIPPTFCGGGAVSSVAALIAFLRSVRSFPRVPSHGQAGCKTLFAVTTAVPSPDYSQRTCVGCRSSIVVGRFRYK